MTKSESIPVKILSAMSGQVGIFLLGLIGQILIARALGPTGKGLFTLTITTATTVMMVVNLSLSSANSHFAGRHPEYKSALVGNSIFISIVWGALITVILAVWGNGLHTKYVNSLDGSLWSLVLVSIVPLLLFEFGNNLLIGFDKIKIFSGMLLLKELVITVGIFVLIRQSRISSHSAVSVWLLSNALIALTQIIIAWKFVGSDIQFSPNLLWKVAGFSLKSHIANLTSFLRMRADIFLVAYFLGSNALGIYSISQSFVMLLWYFPMAIAQVLIPYISWRDNDAGNAITPLLGRIAFTTCFAGAVLIALLGYPTIKVLFGDKFLPAYVPLLIMLPGSIIYGLGRVVAGDLFGRGMPQFAMIISVIALIVNIGLNLVLIPKMDVLGAALTACLTQIISGGSFLFVFLKKSNVNMKEMFFMKVEDFKLIKMRFLSSHKYAGLKS